MSIHLQRQHSSDKIMVILMAPPVSGLVRLMAKVRNIALHMEGCILTCMTFVGLY